MVCARWMLWEEITQKVRHKIQKNSPNARRSIVAIMYLVCARNKYAPDFRWLNNHRHTFLCCCRLFTFDCFGAHTMCVCWFLFLVALSICHSGFRKKIEHRRIVYSIPCNRRCGYIKSWPNKSLFTRSVFAIFSLARCCHFNYENDNYLRLIDWVPLYHIQMNDEKKRLHNES